MTAFYAPLRGIQNAIDQIITLDGQMVELKRVMDAAPHTYNNLLKESIDLSNKLGNTVTETQQAMNEWARQGEVDSTLSDLAETAVVATNISDIQDTTEAVGVLTAARKAYNIEASDSMSIIDKLNEVDNNFSITTRDLALSMQRGASVAAIYNVSLDELIGMTTAIGQVTRESGNVIGRIYADIKPLLIDLEILTVRLRTTRAKFKYTLND